MKRSDTPFTFQNDQSLTRKFRPPSQIFQLTDLVASYDTRHTLHQIFHVELLIIAAIFGVITGLVILDLLETHMYNRNFKREWKREEELRRKQDVMMTKLFPPRHNSVSSREPAEGTANKRVWREENDLGCVSRKSSTEGAHNDDFNPPVIKLTASTRMPF
jgi:hypothetical protein